ncbi:hypothetical protein [Curtobacterium herbarum]|uniref:hypothetical protein n=1 Tax=Curtobacterium herbarum TaxID=150122 RepID=UPI00195D08A9|nr:hypothetical protein [Curtobacterium herbarum]MBM7475490.1 phosphoserine aminotransferase [Curtobacterium herbarum]MCS6543406.1 hypothetical protein [Curtobacterium herbarum]
MTKYAAIVCSAQKSRASSSLTVVVLLPGAVLSFGLTAMIVSLLSQAHAASS